jgi:transcriptional regulator of arginine metabolism
LVEELKKTGFFCTQATISRDINDMGLRKLTDGVYMLSEDLHLQRMISDLVDKVTVTENFVVVKTTVGTAQGVAAALDNAELPTTLGSIAGDDTILVITTDNSKAKDLESMINKLKIK